MPAKLEEPTMPRYVRNAFQVEVQRLAAVISQDYLDEVRRCEPDHRRLDTPIGWQRKNIHAGQLLPAGALPVILAESLLDDTPTDRILRLIRAGEATVRRHRSANDAASLAAAIAAETEKECVANPTQNEVLITRSVGAMRKLRDQYLAHREALDRAVVALDHEIHLAEAMPHLARAQLGLQVPA